MGFCRRWRFLSRMVVVCAELFLVGPTKANAQDSQTTEEDSPAAVVEMTDSFKFKPAKITVQAGQTVKWINEPSTIVHTVTADPTKARKSDSVRLPEGAETFASGEMQPGDVFTHQFTVPGRYKYFCIPHELANMIGEVEVTEVEVKSGEQDGQQTGGPAPPTPATDQQPDKQTTAAEQKAAEQKTEGKQPEGKAADQTQDSQSQDSQSQDSQAERDKTPDPTFVFGAHAAPRPPEYREATGFWKFVYWLGNFHPAATDVPVGITLAAFLSELLLLTTGKSAFATIIRFCVWVAGISALGTAILGWCLAGFQFYDNAWMLTTHRVLGTATGIWGLVMIATMEAARSKNSSRWQWTFRSVLLIATILIVVTGFFGGGMIYGLDHYDWPSGENG